MTLFEKLFFHLCLFYFTMKSIITRREYDRDFLLRHNHRTVIS